YIADKLKKIQDKDFLIIDCETVPENYTSIVKNQKPKNLLIIDAVKMGLPPGEIRIIPKEKIGLMHISTHNIPISVLISYLESYADNIVLIGIEPKKLSGKITETIKKSADKLVKIIKNLEIEKIETLQ
ncbi:MAG: hydrogenase 3 maturation endopeptidase HyCI, partial [Euryarchaeota archaeon RBG_13_31_8]